MSNSINPRLKKSLLLGLKVAVAGAAIGYVAYKIFTTKSLDQISAYTLGLARQPKTYWGFGAVLLLMFANWSIESFKWRLLIRTIEPINHWRAFRAVLAGLTMSTFTPNRIGEYAGRVLHLQHASKGQGTLLTLVGNFAQLLLTIVIGSIAFVISVLLWPDGFPSFMSATPSLVALIAGSLIGSVFFTVLFLRTSRWSVWMNRFKYLKRFDRYHAVLMQLSLKSLIPILGLALVRFIIFSVQYALLLHIFGVPLSFGEAIILVPATFFVMMAIPTIALTEVGAREIIGLHFFGLASGNELGIIAATFALWLINLAIPALLGTIFVLGYQTENATQHESVAVRS